MLHSKQWRNNYCGGSKMKTLDILKRTQKERERYQKALSAATTEEERKFLLDEHVFFMAHLGTDKENRQSFLSFQAEVEIAKQLPKIPNYKAREIYHAELMERFFKNSNPMTDPDAEDKFKKIGVKMKERFSDV